MYFESLARIPSLSELESGVTVPVTGGPQPPVPQTQEPWPPSSEYIRISPGLMVTMN